MYQFPTLAHYQLQVLAIIEINGVTTSPISHPVDTTSLHDVLQPFISVLVFFLNKFHELYQVLTPFFEISILGTINQKAEMKLLNQSIRDKPEIDCTARFPVNLS
eukprot:NODE_200_length_13167_cov_0.338537.p5 type:complete len:105 gc:universal NODE_200_length_13167_cov_0.338537:1685-1371(-)